MAIYIGKTSSELQMLSPGINRQQVIAVIAEWFKPEIGKIKYLARNHPLVVDVQSTAFDGWVYADGQQYSKDDFPSAYGVFGSRFGSTQTTFAVPDMRGFIRSAAVNSEIQHIAGNFPIPSHYHDVDSDIAHSKDGVIKNAFAICQSQPQVSFNTQYDNIGLCPETVTSEQIKPKTPYYPFRINPDDYEKCLKRLDGAYAGYVPVCHSAGNQVSKNDRQILVDMTITASVKFDDVKTGSAGSASDACPKNAGLQVMIYIGKKGD